MPSLASLSRSNLNDGVVSEAAIAITGATGRARSPAKSASAHLIAKPLSSEHIAQAALLASQQAEDTLSDHYASADYRERLVTTEVGRALASLKGYVIRLVGRARGAVSGAGRRRRRSA